MKIVKLLALVLVMGGSVFTSNALFAHTALTEAMPADGSVINEAPDNVTLRFTEEVRLLQLSVTDSASHEVETGFTPTANAQNAFSIMLPTLAADIYTVEWTVLGNDSHRVEGAFTFTFDPSAETMSTHADMPEHHDAH